MPIENVTFDSFYASRKDTGITLHEIEIRAMGSIFGVIGAPGSNVEDTLLGTFSTASVPVVININNETGADVAAAISGSFDGSVQVERSLLPEDIKFCYRVTTTTGVSEWHCVHYLAACPAGTINLTVDPPDAMTENAQKQNWVWTIEGKKGDGTPLLGGDFILIQIQRDSNSAILAYAYIPIGGDPTDPTDVTNESNWNSLGANDTNIATYLEVVTSFSSPNLDAGLTQVKFAKKLWAVANGIAGINGGETINVIVTAIDSNCNQVPTPDTGAMTPIIFAEMFLPFLGKQSATPYSEYNYPLVEKLIGSTNFCSANEWFGISIRNGALTSPIAEIRIDVDDNATDVDTFNQANAPIHFPLPPLAHNDAIVSCTGGSSTPLLGFDFSAYFVDPGNSYNKGITAMVEEADGHIRNSAEIDYDVPYYGTVPVTMNWSMYMEANNTDDPDHKEENWSFNSAVTRALIVRGDAAVYGSNTQATGLVVDLAFNINTTRVSLTGATAWTANTKVQISSTSGLIPGALVDYDIVSPPGAGVTGALPAVPGAAVAAVSITINRMFAAEGIYYVKIVAETDVSPDGKVFKSEAVGYLMLASS